MVKAVNATIRFAGDDYFIGITPSGHSLTLDTNHERLNGPSPVELLLVALGACTAVDVAGILTKKRQHVTNYIVEVEGERRDEHPRKFMSMKVRHILTGTGITNLEAWRLQYFGSIDNTGDGKPDENHLSPTIALYLYGRSFFLQDVIDLFGRVDQSQRALADVDELPVARCRRALVRHRAERPAAHRLPRDRRRGAAELVGRCIGDDFASEALRQCERERAAEVFEHGCPRHGHHRSRR